MKERATKKNDHGETIICGEEKHGGKTQKMRLLIIDATGTRMGSEEGWMT